jgi:hypothetical protein
MSKSTVYIDVEDEITTIIDKLKEAPELVVALVLPKRASVLQSIINLKLLKRAAQQSRKKVVLITTDSSVLALAGTTGMHVAASLQSKPYIPEKPTVLSEETVDESEAALDRTKTIQELDTTTSTVQDVAADLDEATLTMPESADDLADTEPEQKLKKQFRVPNFEKFRLRFFLAIAGFVLLVAGWFFAFVVMPKASIVITAERTGISIDQTLTAAYGATTYDIANPLVFPATKQTAKKTFQQTFTATGQKDNGQKATGKMTVYNCNKQDQSVAIPSGTMFTSGGLQFATEQSVTVAASNSTGSGVCKKDKTAIVNVVAAKGGDNYNLSAREYSSSIADISGSGSVMSGGTTKIVTVVSQDDASAATDTVLSSANETVQQELADTLTADGFVPVTESFETTKGSVTLTPAVDQEAQNGTASVEFTYTMTGVKRSALEQQLDTVLAGKIDASKQAVVDRGIDSAQVKVTQKTADSLSVSFKTTAYAGPNLDTAAITNEVLGKSLGDTESLLRARPGVTDVKIDYNPFWVFSTPKAANKVTVTFEVPVTTEQK